MKGFDCKQSKVVVKTQDELDLIPEDYKGQIYIEGGVWYNKIKVGKRYYCRVIARGNSSVEARGNSSVVAWENSSVVAWENSSVEAWGNSSVVARGNSSVEARGNSSVVARGNSSVVAWENSSVVAWENSSVVAWENSSVEANANAQVVDCLQGAKIKISGNARIVYNPKNIYEFMDFYGVKHTKTKATFYKAVHKKGGEYISDYNRCYKYEIGKTHTEFCDSQDWLTCRRGLHIAHLDWALRFGSDWEDIAILEVETKISDIVMPIRTDGKVRTSELKVIREVPLEDCGVYGKIIARRVKK